MAALDTVRDRLAAAWALGLPVPDGLDDASPDVVDAVLRRLAREALDSADAQIADLERQRGALEAIAACTPSADA